MGDDHLSDGPESRNALSEESPRLAQGLLLEPLESLHVSRMTDGSCPISSGGKTAPMFMALS
jgi:hypothetical protein